MDNYVFIRVVGKGSYGEVNLVKHKADKKQYVIKKLNLTTSSKRERRAAEQEAQLLSQLRHPNIVTYRESWEGADLQLYIVMGFCEGGDLYHRLKQQKGELLPERQVVEWFVQIAMALEYLHKRNILHRDLKTQNIFLTKTNIIKVGDLGIARVLENQNDMASTLIGTPYYMSPELFSNKPYNHKSDVWALGCCVYEMSTLKHAFNAKDMNSLVYRIVGGKLPQMPIKYDPQLGEMIKSMLCKKPEDRPNVNFILRQPYIKRQIAIFLEATKVKTAKSRQKVVGGSNDIINNNAANVAPPQPRPPSLRQEAPPKLKQAADIDLSDDTMELLREANMPHPKLEEEQEAALENRSAHIISKGNVEGNKNGSGTRSPTQHENIQENLESTEKLLEALPPTVEPIEEECPSLINTPSLNAPFVTTLEPVGIHQHSGRSKGRTTGFQEMPEAAAPRPLPLPPASEAAATEVRKRNKDTESKKANATVIPKAVYSSEDGPFLMPQERPLSARERRRLRQSQDTTCQSGAARASYDVTASEAQRYNSSVTSSVSDVTTETTKERPLSARERRRLRQSQDTTCQSGAARASYDVTASEAQRYNSSVTSSVSDVTTETTKERPLSARERRRLRQSQDTTCQSGAARASYDVTASEAQRYNSSVTSSVSDVTTETTKERPLSARERRRLRQSQDTTCQSGAARASYDVTASEAQRYNSSVTSSVSDVTTETTKQEKMLEQMLDEEECSSSTSSTEHSEGDGRERKAESKDMQDLVHMMTQTLRMVSEDRELGSTALPEFKLNRKYRDTLVLHGKARQEAENLSLGEIPLGSSSGPAKIRRAIELLRTDVVKGLGVKLLDKVLEIMEEEDDIKREVRLRQQMGDEKYQNYAVMVRQLKLFEEIAFKV
ncbi:serine/threonine-protein kinase Nek4 isoform X2 [Entelurus aequoreus]|uniref:serine/threonine-protein kinase Nek4 isoform X2 n=1 Tax=Entelurus aequoreus TaxID=161455 RepID=UPI002B1DA19B|nr:serine/threonine-protein kinase Nek4 isoform X2 [Entelurus aequoreus]